MRRSMILLAATLLATAAQARTASPRDAVRTWRQAHEQQIYADFARLLAMPGSA